MSPITRSRSPWGTSSASPPKRLTKSRTHSAARRRSSWCAGSALTDGIAMNSRNSSSQACSTAGEFSYKLGDVAQLDRVGQRPELLQALVLDLADALTRDVERAAHLVERARMLAVEAVPKLEHLALPARERAEDLAQGLLAECDLGLLVGQREILVGDEVAEFRLVLIADGLLERHRRLGAAPDLLNLVACQVEVEPDLQRCRLAPQLGTQLALRTHHLVQLLDDVNRHADRPC